jgi:hypothetical protein
MLITRSVPVFTKRVNMSAYIIPGFCFSLSLQPRRLVLYVQRAPPPQKPHRPPEADIETRIKLPGQEDRQQKVQDEPVGKRS